MALRAGSAAALLCIGVPSAVSAQSEFEEFVKLDELDGTDGFAFSTISAYEYSGIVVSGAGDINGDGFDDVAIAMWGAQRSYDYAAGNFLYGATFVVFGDESVGSTGYFDVTDLDGSNGFVILDRDSRGLDRSVGNPT